MKKLTVIGVAVALGLTAAAVGSAATKRIFISGQVTSADSVTHLVTVAAHPVFVSVTRHLPRVGDTVRGFGMMTQEGVLLVDALVGVEPNTRVAATNSLLPDAVIEQTNCSLLAVQMQSITGSGVQSITGSGVQSITGSGRF